MKKNIVIFLLLSIFFVNLFQPITEASDTQYEYYDAASNNAWNIYAARWKAQTFTVGTVGANEKHNITSVKLKLYKAGTPTGYVNVSIRATSASKPTGADLAFSQRPCSDVTSYTWYEFTFSAPYTTLNPGTMYAIVVRATSCTSSSNDITWGSVTLNPYAGGSYCGSTDSGVVWSTGTDDLLFYEYGLKFNNAPTIVSVDPLNESTDISIIPTLETAITDTNADKMTLTWSSNSSGSWVNFGLNTSCDNGTYRWINSNFSEYSTTYWWRLNLTDGSITISEIFHFTTESPPLIIESPNPANGSIDVSYPTTTCINISSDFSDIDEERYEWYVPGPMSASFFGRNFWNAQNFTVGSVGTNEDFFVTNITLELVKVTGETVGDIEVSIRSDISGPDLCSGTIDGDLLIDDSTPPMLERINITMTPNILLSADTNYFIITRAPDAEDTSSCLWYYIYDTGAYPGGWFFTSNDAGVSWSDDTYNTSDHWFQVWGYEESECLYYEFWTNESGSWEMYGNGTACSNGTYCANNNFTNYLTTYYWSINVSANGDWTNITYHFTTEGPSYTITLSNEDPADGSTAIVTISTEYYNATNEFWMNITRSHSGSLDMNTTIWFNGSLLFTNTTWGDGYILFNLFDYWAGPLVNGTIYNWTVNASDNWGFYCNETQGFLFTINASFLGGVISGATIIIEEKDMMIGLCFVFFLAGTLILRSAAKSYLKKR